MDQKELYQKYIVENLSRKDCAAFFNTSESTIKRKIKEYHLNKSREQMNRLMSNSQRVQIDRDLLYDAYIVQNLSLKECADLLKQSPSIIKRRLRDYNIQKNGEKFKEVHRKYANQQEESARKRQATVLARYGVSNVSKSDSIKTKKGQTTAEHYGVNNPFMSENIKKQIKDQNLEKYGVPYTCMREECRKYSGNDSKPNQEFEEILKEYNVQYTREFPLENYSYDFKVGDILFEINPTIFHNSTFAPVGLPKDNRYHQRKTIVAKKHGYKCVHVFDWDDPEKIIRTFCAPKERIYARDCEVKLVPFLDAKIFLDKNHLQGYAKDQIRLGLYHNDELVEIMTFGEPRYNKKYDYELIRLCSIKNVVGGPERLLAHFLEHHNPQALVSYCDLSKFDGNIYYQLGFEPRSYPQPSKHWVSLKDGKHITDNLLRQKGFDQLFKTNYGKGTSNEELMKEHGFVEIYDCGQRAFRLTK